MSTIRAFFSKVHYTNQMHATLNKRSGRLLDILCMFNYPCVQGTYSFKKLQIYLQSTDDVIGPEYKTIRNLGQNICRPSNIFAHLLSITNEMELDYYHQKVNVRVVSRVAERLKTPDLRNLRKSLKCLYLITSTQPVIQKARKKTYFT